MDFNLKLSDVQVLAIVTALGETAQNTQELLDEGDYDGDQTDLIEYVKQVNDARESLEQQTGITFAKVVEDYQKEQQQYHLVTASFVVRGNAKPSLMALLREAEKKVDETFPNAIVNGDVDSDETEWPED